MPPSSDRLVTRADPQGPAAEAYRSLRTNLLVMLPGPGPHRVLFTSPEADDAVAEVLANLAVVLAGSGRRVVVVDGDLRRPRQHRLFGVAAEPGLSNLLTLPAGTNGSTATPTDGNAGGGPQTVPDIAGIRVLPAGPPPELPAELLARDGLGDCLAALAADADWLLVSAPPVVTVTDAAILAQHVDGVILVLAAGQSRRDRTVDARARLDAVGAKTLGVVLVGVDVP